VNRRVSNCVAFASALCCVSLIAQAKEVDQFTDRWAVLRYYAGGYRKISGAPSPGQVDRVLDMRMNQLLDQLSDRLRDKPPSSLAARDERVREVFQHPYLPELITPYEEWVESEARVPLYKVRDKGIYGNAVNYDDMRMVWYISLSSMIQIDHVLIGTDKLGHFLAQGFQYYQHYRELSSTLSVSTRCAAVRARGHAQEFGQLGIGTGGVYSFADLASNWDGMTFFLALFDDIDIEGLRRARYFERTDSGAYRRVRDFHWAEYVTSDWDEVLNPTGTERRELYRKIASNFWRAPRSDAGGKSICEHYREDPAAYLGPSRPLRARGSYTLASAGRRVAPFSLDVRVICARR
jgi:hypothetical protein